jgi:peptidoglycan hydrolase-like protein with peptidoglycan-binding domain
MATLKKGSAGPDVRNVQQMLNRLIPVAPQLTVDGIFGPKTEARAIEFQKKNRLVADGIVGPLTTKSMITGVMVATFKR